MVQEAKGVLVTVGLCCEPSRELTYIILTICQGLAIDVGKFALLKDAAAPCARYYPGIWQLLSC